MLIGALAGGVNLLNDGLSVPVRASTPAEEEEQKTERGEFVSVVRSLPSGVRYRTHRIASGSPIKCVRPRAMDFAIGQASEYLGRVRCGPGIEQHC